ncbi:MAG: type II toxin-antitoxin system RelE/ParE family toxin [Caulobacteraceae bacterium]
MGHVTITPRAQVDLDDIWLHIAVDSPAAADRLIDQIVLRCQTLADHPELGRLRPEIAPEARMLTIGNYLALYRIVYPAIDIVRVVHGARQLEKLFDDVARHKDPPIDEA